MQNIAQNINQYIEHTLLAPANCTISFLNELIREAKEHRFLGVCVPPYWVKWAKRELEGTNIQVVTVIGFPLGYSLSKIKKQEAEMAIVDGAQEIDLVMNLSAFRENPTGWTKPEIAQLANTCHQKGALLKVIFETAYLTDDEIVLACKLCEEAGADFVKTSTGFAHEGAKKHHIELMRQSLDEQVGIKASGGIKSFQFAKELIEAGADRIGTSSGVKIVEEARLI